MSLQGKWARRPPTGYSLLLWERGSVLGPTQKLQGGSAAGPASNSVLHMQGEAENQGPPLGLGCPSHLKSTQRGGLQDSPSTSSSRW